MARRARRERCHQPASPQRPAARGAGRRGPGGRPPTSPTRPRCAGRPPARERFGALQGAIHAAGLPGGGVIQLKTAEAAERVLAPKLQGTRSLAGGARRRAARRPRPLLLHLRRHRRRRPGRLLRGQQLPRRLRPPPFGRRHADGRDRLGGLAGGRHGGRGLGHRPGEPRPQGGRRAGRPPPRDPPRPGSIRCSNGARRVRTAA